MLRSIIVLCVLVLSASNLAGQWSVDTSLWTGESGTNCTPVPGDYRFGPEIEFAALCGGAWDIYNSVTGQKINAVWVGAHPGVEVHPVPADFVPNGAGKIDVAIFREGAWDVFNTVTGALISSTWTGSAVGCQPIVGNFTGDATPELATVCPIGASSHSVSVYEYPSGTLLTNYIAQQMAGNDVTGPVTAMAVDWDGDQVDEICLFASGAWFTYDYPIGNTVREFWTGPPEADPVPLDTDGDGRDEPGIYCDNGGSNCSSGILAYSWHLFNYDVDADIASYREGVWIGNSPNVTEQVVSKATRGDVVVDWDRDGGRDNIMVYREGAWFMYKQDYLWSHLRRVGVTNALHDFWFPETNAQAATGIANLGYHSVKIWPTTSHVSADVQAVINNPAFDVIVIRPLEFSPLEPVCSGGSSFIEENINYGHAASNFYANHGHLNKHIILSGWEADNQISRFGCITPSQQEKDAFLAKLNERQSGVAAVRQANLDKKLRVWHAVEVNLVNTGPAFKVFRDIVPLMDEPPDMISYSAWGTNASSVGDRLDLIAATTGLDQRQIFIGEFGRDECNGQDVSFQVENHGAAAFAAGVPFVFYWYYRTEFGPCPHHKVINSDGSTTTAHTGLVNLRSLLAHDNYSHTQ